MRFNPTAAGQAVLAVLLALFGNQVSVLLDLPRFWLVFVFALLVLASVWFQALQRVVDAAPVSTRVDWRNARQLAGLARTHSFPLSLALGSLVTMLAVRLDGRSGLFSFIGYAPARAHELTASVACIVLCLAYRWTVGAKGLGLFGLGLGLSVGATLVTLVPEQHLLLLTLYAHTVVIGAIALTLSVDRRGWWKALSIPAVLGSFYLLPSILFWLFQLSGGPPPGARQGGNLEYFAPGHHRHYYEVPFQEPPSLTVRPSSNRTEFTFRIVEQHTAWFELEVNSTEFPVGLIFEAQGTPKSR